MASKLMSLKNFLQERHLTRKNDGIFLALTRQRLEESPLLKTMRDVCAAINSEAGTMIVDEHHDLPPEPVVSSFASTRGQTEYVMRLEVWSERPSLLFVTRKWRDSSQSPLLQWLYRLAEVEPLSVTLKFSFEIQEDDASEERIKQYFFYLLSGFSRSYIPSFQPRNGPTKVGWKE
jgi:hypothetical protein